MDKRINIKHIVIVISVIIAVVVAVILVTFGVKKYIVHTQMKTAITETTINEDVILYRSAKQTKQIQTIDIGTDVYVLKNITDGDGNQWSKVKFGKKVGYVLSENLSKFEKSNMKMALMLDVSKFNLTNNFSSIGEFKAFILNNNIQYVYIRAGGRGYGEAGNFYTDSNFQDFAQACEDLNVPFGFYFLDEAITSEEVDEEVQFIKEFLENNNYEYNTLPVALDVEKHVETGRADGIWDTRYLLVNELIEKLENDNIYTILYSNAYTAGQYLSNVNTEMWLAYYPDLTEIPDYWYSETSEESATNEELISKMVAWQFTESGVDGVINKAVDISLVYNNYFSTGSMNDIKNDITEKSETVSKIFTLKDKNKEMSIFILLRNLSTNVVNFLK